MIKQLYLFRHSEVEDKSAPKRDMDRELTQKGVNQSLQMGVYLARENILPDAIFCSTSARTKQTLQLACHEMRFPSHKIFYENFLYEATVKKYIDFITKVDNSYDRIMFVGHNPTISEVAGYITDADIVEMDTAGIAIINLDITSWEEVSKGNGDLIKYVDPKLVMKK
jgi:phosphohistidine phosphatase